jgi:hypothetical protein
MGNTPIVPHERHNLVTIPEVTSSQDGHVSEMTRKNSVKAIASELESTQDDTARYLPKTMNRSNKSVVMSPRPYSGIESPQWGWYINITSPTTEMYHSGSRPPLRKNEDSSVNASQAPTRYLPKAMNRSNNGVVMPSKPYGCGGASTAGGIESPQSGSYVSVTPPASNMYHWGSRRLPKQQDSSANAWSAISGTVISESSNATSHQPNRIFQDMQKGASMGWSSVPL